MVSFYLLSMLLSQSLVTEVVYYNSFSEQLTYDRVLELYGTLKKYSWVGFVCFPFFLLLKVTVVSLVLYVGIIFFNLQKQFSLGMMFRVVTGSEIVFVIAGISKVLWFYFFAGNYTITDISFFYPASLINLFTPEEVDSLWIFPLQTANLFNIVYLLLLAYGISVIGNVNKAFSEKIVLSTYVPALLFWIALVMFLTINQKI